MGTFSTILSITLSITLLLSGCTNHSMLPPGWQLYDNPTTLEPPGTVFRIDSDGRKFQVEGLIVPVTTGAEVMGKTLNKIETKGNFLARFLGIASEGGGGISKKEILEFEMKDTERSITTDVEVDKVLEEFKAVEDPKPKNRYFLIREARSATEVHYKLAKEVIGDLGGSAKLMNLTSARASFEYDSKKEFNLSQKFPVRMGVMYLAEEIKEFGKSLGTEGPELGLIPVKEVLEWKN